MKFFFRLTYFVSFYFVISCASQSPVAKVPPLRTLLLISMDGFRWDYLDKTDTPNLHAFLKDGVRAKGLQSVFPSVTFPNHYTIVTGLYAEHHGIVSNEMYDPSTKKHFDIKTTEVDAPDWWGGEPLWVSAEKQGIRTGTMFWVGSTAEIKGVRPTYFEKYDAKVTKSDRIAKVLGWLDIPLGKRPRFLTLYFEDADTIGHKFGPDSPEEKKAIEGLDAAFGELWSGLKSRGLEDSTDIVIVSDHGMATVEANHVIHLDSLVKAADVEMVGGGAFANLWPKKGKENVVFKALSRAKSHYQVYRKNEIPERFHYREHRRIAPILVVADEGWYLAKFGTSPKFNAHSGTHGYDPELESMQGTLLARGPSFHRGIEIGSVHNTDLYELMCHILGIKPAPNDGNFLRVQAMLKSEAPVSASEPRPVPQ